MLLGGEAEELRKEESSEREKRQNEERDDCVQRR